MKLNSTPRELDIEELTVKENIRKEYNDIPELAASILKFGQLQSIGIDKDKNVIFGHRRVKAIQHIFDTTGTRLKVKVEFIQGDRKALQMIENLHQSEMTPTEKEQGVKALIDDGMKQVDVATYLCLRPQQISDILTAGRVREVATAQGIDTSTLSSSALSVARGVEPEQLEQVIEKAKEKGGTVKAVKQAVKEISPEAEKFIFDDKKTVNKDLADDVVKPKEGGTLKKVEIESPQFKISECSTSVKCFRSCKNNSDEYCDLKVIEIDSFGLCGNFEEVGN